MILFLLALETARGLTPSTVMAPETSSTNARPTPAPTTPAEPTDPLSSPVTAFRAQHLPLDSALLALAHTYAITFDADPVLKAPITLQVTGGTLRSLIDAVARAAGACWERDGRTIILRRNVLRTYPIEYPQLSRSAQGSSTVVLTAQSAPGASNGTNGSLAAGSSFSPSSAATSSSAPADQTNLSLQQQNPSTFWADIQTELTTLAEPGETVILNRLAGMVTVSAPPARQSLYRAFLRELNHRISRQVRITARILEVTLNRTQGLGVDWSAAATRIGGIGGIDLSNAATSTALTTLNGQPLSAPTVSGTLSTRKISALVQALAEQGEVRAVSNPSILTLSNQTAFVKVGTEQTFFSLANATTLNQPGTTTPFSSTQKNYTQNAITIGTVLYVTPKVNGDGSVTVDILPAVTQLIGVDASPDGEQTAPRMDIKALSTLARLHPGEAVVIGGLIHEEDSRQQRSVPGLSRLPLLGSLFGTQARSHLRTELVIFLMAEQVP